MRVQGVGRTDDGRVTGIVGMQDGCPLELCARIVVGADGLRSRIARQWSERRGTVAVASTLTPNTG